MSSSSVPLFRLHTFYTEQRSGITLNRLCVTGYSLLPRLPAGSTNFLLQLLHRLDPAPQPVVTPDAGVLAG